MAFLLPPIEMATVMEGRALGLGFLMGGFWSERGGKLGLLFFVFCNDFLGGGKGGGKALIRGVMETSMKNEENYNKERMHTPSKLQILKIRNSWPMPFAFATR